MKPAPDISDPLPTVTRVVRTRSLPSSRPFNIAAFFSSIHYLGIVTTLTGFGLIFFDGPSSQNFIATKITLGGLGFSAVSWMVAFFKRRAAHCPLCKGTPLVSSGALPHSKATRIYPFNHGVSAIFSIMTTQKFRCMYCGSAFDLLKTPSYRRKPQASDEPDYTE